MQLSKNLHWFNLNTFLKFAGGNLVYQLITIFCDVWILKMVDVNSMGIWQYALLLQSYVIISRLGILNAFNREYPYLLSLNENKNATTILNTTAFHVSLSCFLQATFFLCFGAVQFYNGHTNVGVAMFAMLAYTIFDAFANFEEAKLRGGLQFNIISNSKVLLSFFSLLTILLPLKFGFNGLLIRAVSLQIILFAFLKYFSSIKSNPRLKINVWLSLFQDGWRFWLWSYVRSFNKSLPKLFILNFAGLSVLGLFTPINWILLSFTLITSNISTYLYPMLSQRFAKGEQNLLSQTLKINFIAFLVGLPIAIVGVICIPFLVKTFLPEYAPATFPMQLALFASLFDIIAISATVWASMKNWKKMYISSLSITVINLISLGWLYINQNNALYNIGYSILFSSIASALLIVLMILYHEAKIKKETSILYI